MSSKPEVVETNLALYHNCGIGVKRWDYCAYRA